MYFAVQGVRNVENNWARRLYSRLVVALAMSVASCQELPADNCRIKASNSAVYKRKKSRKAGAARHLFWRMRGNAKERTRGLEYQKFVTLRIGKEKYFHQHSSTASLLRSTLTSFLRIQFAVHATRSFSPLFEIS